MKPAVLPFQVIMRTLLTLWMFGYLLLVLVYYGQAGYKVLPDLTELSGKGIKS